MSSINVRWDLDRNKIHSMSMDNMEPHCMTLLEGVMGDNGGIMLLLFPSELPLPFKSQQ